MTTTVIRPAQGRFRLTERRLQLGANWLIVRCDPAYVLQADFVLKTISNFFRKGLSVSNNVRIHFGWSAITLVRSGNDLIAHEPDFSRNPLVDMKDSITVTLKILVEQTIMNQKVGVKPLSCTFKDWVVVNRSCLNQRRVALKRFDECESKGEPEWSGWVMSPLDGDISDDEFIDEVDHKSLYSYYFLKVRPSVLKALTLPRGYSVLLDGNDIASVLDQDNKDVLMRKN